jgi:hypothetical protein
MKLNLRAAAFFLTIFAISFASGGQVDPRFDGQWAGVEIFPPPAYAQWAHQNPQYHTVFSISNGGQIVAVRSGFVPGRYWIDPKSNGNTLLIYGNNGRAGRNLCRLQLGDDGNTIKEYGNATLSIHPIYNEMTRGANYHTTTQVMGTFKRVGGAPSQTRKAKS